MYLMVTININYGLHYPVANIGNKFKQKKWIVKIANGEITTILRRKREKINKLKWRDGEGEGTFDYRNRRQFVWFFDCDLWWSEPRRCPPRPPRWWCPPDRLWCPPFRLYLSFLKREWSDLWCCSCRLRIESWKNWNGLWPLRDGLASSSAGFTRIFFVW